MKVHESQVMWGLECRCEEAGQDWTEARTLSWELGVLNLLASSHRLIAWPCKLPPRLFPIMPASSGQSGWSRTWICPYGSLCWESLAAVSASWSFNGLFKCHFIKGSFQKPTQKSWSQILKWWEMMAWICYLMIFFKVQNRLSEKKTGDRIKHCVCIFIYICVFIARNALKRSGGYLYLYIFIYMYIYKMLTVIISESWQ